jgi:MFS family permease
VLIAVHTASLPLFFVGTLITGSGFGSGFLGALRSIMPLALPHERAGLMSAFYVLSYLAFSLPSLLAGNLTRLYGLIPTTNGFGAVLILMAVGALAGLLRQSAKPLADGLRS